LNSSTDRSRAGTTSTSRRRARARAFAGSSWGQSRDACEPVAQVVEAQDLCLEVAELQRHRIEVSLDLFLRALRFLALVGQDDRLEPRVIDRRGPLERQVIERQREHHQQDEHDERDDDAVAPVERERPRPGARSADQYDVHVDSLP
jgi:hypothetical protein